MARRVKWEDTLLDEVISSGAGSNPTLMGSTTPNESEGETIIRCIGELSLFSASIAGAYGVQGLDIGVGVASQEAFAAQSLSDPNTASEEPRGGWLFRTRCTVAQNGTGTPVIYVCKFDMRSARKIDGDELFVAFRSANVLGTSFVLRVHGIVRCLFKLP